MTGYSHCPQGALLKARVWFKLLLPALLTTIFFLFLQTTLKNCILCDCISYCSEEHQLADKAEHSKSCSLLATCLKDYIKEKQHGRKLTGIELGLIWFLMQNWWCENHHGRFTDTYKIKATLCYCHCRDFLPEIKLTLFFLCILFVTDFTILPCVCLLSYKRAKNGSAHSEHRKRNHSPGV